MEEYRISFIKRTTTRVYVPGTVINSSREPTELEARFNGLLIAGKPYDSKDVTSHELVALLGTKEMPMYAGQKVRVRQKSPIENHKDDDWGNIVHQTSDFELVLPRPDVTQYGDVIKSLVDVKGDISKLILHEPMKEDFSNFPLMLLVDPSLSRGTKALLEGYPNTVFEVPTGNGAVMVGYLYNNHSMFPHRKQRLEEAGYVFKEMPSEFAGSLKDTQLMIPLTEEIAKLWTEKMGGLPKQVQK